MAAHGDAQTDMPAHVSSYSRFISMMKVGAVLSFVAGIIVILLIAN